MGVAREGQTDGRVRGGLRVIVLVYPGADLLDVAGPCAVFDAFEQASGRSVEETTPGYRVEVVSTGGGLRVETSCRVPLVAERDYLSVRGKVDTLLVAGGVGAWRAAQDEQLLRWLRHMAPRVRRIGSVCTGAFILAAAGLLDGRRATTHWQCCRRWPATTRPWPSRMTRSSSVTATSTPRQASHPAWTSPWPWWRRTTATTPLCGSPATSSCSCARPGGSRNSVRRLDLQAAERRPIRDLQAWIAGHPSADLSVEALAARVHMSPRNFARVFHGECRPDPGAICRAGAGRGRPSAPGGVGGRTGPGCP